MFMDFLFWVRALDSALIFVEGFLDSASKLSLLHHRHLLLLDYLLDLGFHCFLNLATHESVLVHPRVRNNLSNAKPISGIEG